MIPPCPGKNLNLKSRESRVLQLPDKPRESAKKDNSPPIQPLYRENKMHNSSGGGGGWGVTREDLAVTTPGHCIKSRFGASGAMDPGFCVKERAATL